MKEVQSIMSELQLRYGKQYNSLAYRWSIYNNNPSATLVKETSITAVDRFTDLAAWYCCDTLQPTINESTCEAYLVPFVNGVQGVNSESCEFFDDWLGSYKYFSLDNETWYEYDSDNSSVVNGRRCSVERIDAPGSYISAVTSTNPNAYPQAGCLESDLTKFYAYSGSCGIDEKLPPVGENQFVVCTDTGNFYIDIEGTRYQPNHMSGSGQYTYNLYSVVTTYQKDTSYWPEYLGITTEIDVAAKDTITLATDYSVDSSTGETTLSNPTTITYGKLTYNMSYYASGTSKNVTKYNFTQLEFSGLTGTVTYERYRGGVTESKSKGTFAQLYRTNEEYPNGSIQTINGTEYYVEVVS